MAHGITFDQLGGIYHVGTSTNYTVVHEVVTVLEERIVKTSILGGLEFVIVIDGFREDSGLQMCAGALDGTSVHMQKPSVWGDTY